MLWSLPFVISLLPLTALAGKFYEYPSRSRRSSHARSIHARNNTGKGRTFVLQDLYQGQSFLDEWDFFSEADPTNGNVNYQTKEDAIQKGLAYVQQDGTTVLKVDDFSNVTAGGNRDSVRISTQKNYTGGLFIADFWSMPHGCSVWPAYWSVGPNWPNAGEIDVVEGVHQQPTNHCTLHTSDGCSMPPTSGNITGATLLNAQCESSGTSNAGCGFSDPDPRSYGHDFNILAGGVFAHLWDASGIKIWRFFRPDIPADIQNQTPNPATWGPPAVLFESTSCDMTSHFFEHSLVLDITICGDLGNPTYASSGCPGTCAEAIANNTNFEFAKWQLNYIAVYN